MSIEIIGKANRTINYKLCKNHCYNCFNIVELMYVIECEKFSRFIKMAIRFNKLTNDWLV